MNELDRLRWSWIERCSADLLEWAGILTVTDARASTAGASKLTAALMVAGLSRMIVEGAGPDEVSEAIESGLSLGQQFPSGDEAHGLVSTALDDQSWPRRLPQDPRGTEFMLLEIWAGVRAQEVSPPALHRELAQRWGVRDPRVLASLCRLKQEPFRSFIDVDTWLIDVCEPPGRALAVHLERRANKLLEERLRNPLDVIDGHAPAHVEHLTGALLVLLEMERMLNSSTRATSESGLSFQSAVDSAREAMTAYRSQLVDVMQDLSSYEVELVRNAIFGPNEGEMEQHGPAEVTASLAQPSAAAASPPPSRHVASAQPGQSARLKLSDIDLAVRLRRLWIDDLVPWLVELDNDLAGSWKSTALRRLGLALEILSPINFGMGDPLEDVRPEFLERLTDATDGHVNRARVCFIEDSKYRSPRRATTTERDIFDPGDPGADAAAASAAALRKRLTRRSTPEVRDVLSKLRVSGVSQHRLWLVGADDSIRRAIGSMPGCAFALRESVRLTQSAREPLFTIHADAGMWADSGAHSIV